MDTRTALEVVESYTNTLRIQERRAEALRIVLAMAKAAERMAGALGSVPLCNKEFAYEAFCRKPKGHVSPCSTWWDGSRALDAYREAIR